MKAPISVRRPKLVLLVWMMLIGAMGVAIAVYPQVNLNPTFKTMIMANDPDKAFDHKAKQTLGDDEMIVIAVQNEHGVFDIPTLTYIDHLTTEIEKLDAVRKVYSLTRADDIRGEDGVLVADDLITELPKTPQDLAKIERDAFANPLYVNNIVAPDKKVAGINVELKAGHSTKVDAATSIAIYDIIKKAEGLKPAGVKTYVSGFPVASYLGARYMLSDMLVFSIGAMMMLTIIIFLVLRSWHGVVFTMMCAMASVSTTFGVMTLFGIKISMPLSSIMPLLCAIGMEYSVYVAFAYQHEVQTGGAGRSKQDSLTGAILDVRFTVVMSACCAAAAFGSMVTNPLNDLKLLGTFLAVGTLVCCMATLTIIPAWISLFGFPVPPADRYHHRWLQRIVDFIGRVDTRRPLTVVGMLAVLCAFGVLLMTHMSSNTDAFQYFKKSSSIYQDDMFIRHRMAGDVLIPVVVEAKQVDTFKDPANLAKLDEIAKYALTLPHVTKVMSHADHLELMNEALKSGTPADYKLPTTRAQVEQYLLLHNQPDDFHMWIDPDYKMASISVRMDTMSSTVLLANQAKLKAFAHAKFPQFDARVVGTTLLAHRAFDTMATSMLTGMGVTTLCIFLIMVIGFRSLRLGIVAMIPTLPPALMVYATLPLIGHALDPPTSVTGAIALGIAIDDTTWFLRTWVGWRRKPGVDASAAVVKTLTQIGRPMILSSMVLGTGFLVMLAANYRVLFWLGMMMFIVSFWSVFWDLFCTPTIVRLIDPKLPRRRESEPVPVDR